MKIEEFARVAPEAKHGDAGHLDRNERNDRERERDIEIGIDGTKKGHGLTLSCVEHNTFNTRDKFKPITDQDEQKKRYEKWRKSRCEHLAFERLGDKFLHTPNECFYYDLKFSGYELGITLDQKRKKNKEKYD